MIVWATLTQEAVSAETVSRLGTEPRHGGPLLSSKKLQDEAYLFLDGLTVCEQFLQ